MKKQSEAKYYCDVTKEELKLGPDCQLDFYFGYGSKFDGVNATWHFNTKDAEKVFEMLLKKYPMLIPDFNKKIKI